MQTGQIKKKTTIHMCACLKGVIGLHWFTLLPALALPSFMLPRSITEFPGKHVSNRPFFFSFFNVSMKALKIISQVIITFWVLERSTEVAYLKITSELFHNSVQLFSNSRSKYLLLGPLLQHLFSYFMSEVLCQSWWLLESPPYGGSCCLDEKSNGEILTLWSQCHRLE